MKFFVAGLNECQGFSGESVVSGRVEVCCVGTGVGLVVVIVEICMRVGSCDENDCSEKPDGHDRAAEFWKACSGGINGCHAEKASLVPSEMLEMPLKGLFSPWSSKFVSLIDCSPKIVLSDTLGECEKFSLGSLKSVWLQGLLSLDRSCSSQLSSSSSSEK